jgi:hypothetical protein
MTSCNPFKPDPLPVFDTNSRAPYEQILIPVGHFKHQLCFTDRINRIIDSISNNPDLPIQNNMTVLYEALSFDSLEVDFDNTAQVNQAVTFFLENDVGFGLGCTHTRHIPVYANIMAQVPQITKDLDVHIPNTLGQLVLQFNPYVNPHVVYGLAMPVIGGNVNDASKILSLLPLLARLMISRDLTIYKGFL